MTFKGKRYDDAVKTFDKEALHAVRGSLRDQNDSWAPHHAEHKVLRAWIDLDGLLLDVPPALDLVEHGDRCAGAAIDL